MLKFIILLIGLGTFLPAFSQNKVELVTVIHALDFKRIGKNVGELTLKLSNTNNEYKAIENKNVLKVLFLNSRFSTWLIRKFDLKNFQTIVESIETSNEGNKAILSIQTQANYHYRIQQHNHQILIDLTMKKSKPTSKGLLKLYFQAIPIRAALQQLAQVANINLVINGAVKGTISLRLYNITWEQALQVIMQASGLADKRIGNAYIIAPAAEIKKQEQAELVAQQKIQTLEPLQSELVQINYGKAVEIANLLKTSKQSILSKRGSVSVDERTNTLWIQDTPQKVKEIVRLVRQLDKPVKQVLIEVRVVSIDKSYERQLGIRWGISNDRGLSGTLEGASKIVGGSVPNLVDFTKRLNLDLPAANVGQIGGSASFGLALAKLGGGYLLDLELSALQNNGDAKIISNPRLITANQQPAIIESGEEIPFQNTTLSGGTAVSFKKAVLSLKVTPHITPDNRIILDLKVNQDKRGPEVLAGVPSIDTREIQTQVLVNNGQTIVLGGIFQKSNNKQSARVPFLGNIPILGYLFRNTYTQSKEGELLIFVTPKILIQKS